MSVDTVGVCIEKSVESFPIPGKEDIYIKIPGLRRAERATRREAPDLQGGPV